MRPADIYYWPLLKDVWQLMRRSGLGLADDDQAMGRSGWALLKTAVAHRADDLSRRGTSRGVSSPDWRLSRG